MPALAAYEIRFRALNVNRGSIKADTRNFSHDKTKEMMEVLVVHIFVSRFMSPPNVICDGK